MKQLHTMDKKKLKEQLNSQERNSVEEVLIDKAIEIIISSKGMTLRDIKTVLAVVSIYVDSAAIL
jgi:hypothetical protein